MSPFLRLNKLVGPIVNKQNYGWPVSAAIPSHCQIKNHFSFAIAHLTSKGAVQPPFFIRVSRLLQTNRFILSLRMSRLSAVVTGRFISSTLEKALTTQTHL